MEIKAEQHGHSIALVKKVTGEHIMGDLERWVKIANSVNKELWISNDNN